MQSPWMLLPLLGVMAVSLSTWLQPWFETWAGNRSKSTDILTTALGDSRRLFAKHLYVKADAYFHSGYYPTIFDNQQPEGKLHIASQSAKHEGSDFLGPPKDWIDRFGRNFYPSTHRHLGEKAGHAGHGHGPGEKCEHEDNGEGEQREVLPWLKLAALLDPEQPETYVVAGYCLRTELGNVEQAERFLREGLQANPRHYEILFELGRIYYENRKDPAHARNLWELSLNDWHERQAAKKDPSLLLLDQILGQLARVEEELGNHSQAVSHLEELFFISPSKLHIQKWISELREKTPK